MPIRSWNEFLGLGYNGGWDVSRLCVGGGGRRALARLETNLVYYEHNYIAIYALFLLFVCVSCPAFVAMAIVLAIAASIVQYTYIPALEEEASSRGGSYRRAELSMGEMKLTITLTPSVVRASFALVSLICLLWVSGWTLMWATALATFILVHALFRKRSLKARGSTFIKEHFQSSLLSSVISSIRLASESNSAEDDDYDSTSTPTIDYFAQGHPCNEPISSLHKTTSTLYQRVAEQVRARYRSSPSGKGSAAPNSPPSRSSSTPSEGTPPS